MQNQLDHIAIGATDLTEGNIFLRSIFGVDIPLGGKHVHMGTHNRLMNLQNKSYFELIAIDQDATPPHRPRWFGLDEPATHEKLQKGPAPLSWIVQTNNLDAVLDNSPVELGEVLELHRDDLTWRLTVPNDGKPVMGGLIPAFIEWPPNMHPSHTLPDLGVRLEKITLSHSEPDRLGHILDQLCIRHLVELKQDQTNLSFTFSTPSRHITLG